MLRIAICDDLHKELQSLILLTNQYLSDNSLDAEVAGFSNPDGLLKAFQKEYFHIYILDIVMPMLNGLELGKEIRRLDREAQILYVTTEPQFALMAYAVSPVNYLVKPINKQQLYDTLTHAISKVDIDEEVRFTVKTADSLRLIKVLDIACCEYRSHAVIFNLTNGDEVFSRTIRESFIKYISPILKDRHFLQCHNAFVINMRFVERFTKDSFRLYSGKIVPIAARKYPLVRDTYMDYLMAKGGLK